MCVTGIKEEDLLSKMAALNPLDARRLLDELMGQELVLVSITVAMPAGVPGSPPQAEQVCTSCGFKWLALETFLGSFAVLKDLFSYTFYCMQKAKHLFANASTCFSRSWNVLPELRYEGELLSLMSC